MRVGISYLGSKRVMILVSAKQPRNTPSLRRNFIHEALGIEANSG